MTGHTLSAFVKLMIFAIVTVLATAVLGVTISNRTFGATNAYSAQFTDVTGLLAGDSVRAAGVRIGTVTSIKVVDDKYAQVGFNVNKDVTISTSTKLEMRYLNLVGQRYVAVVEQPGDRASEAFAIGPFTEATFDNEGEPVTRPVRLDPDSKYRLRWEGSGDAREILTRFYGGRLAAPGDAERG